MTSKGFNDDRIYDDFELSTNPSEPPPGAKPRSDAPWLNREKAPENDTSRLLEYERSFKKDQFNEHYPRRAGRQNPTEIESQAKTVRSLQREKMKFGETFSEWAYDDEYDNEDKSDDKDDAAYDPVQMYHENASSRLFTQERFSNTENLYNELLDENYPNSSGLRPGKVGKIRVENKLEEKLKASLIEPRTPRASRGELVEPKTPRASRGELVEPRTPRASRGELIEPKTPRASRGDLMEPKTPRASRGDLLEPKTPRVNRGEDDDVIILDDCMPTSARIRNDTNKIKISLNSDHKLKSFPQDPSFEDDAPVPGTELDHQLAKIPVLETRASAMNPGAGAPASSRQFSNPAFANYFNPFPGATVPATTRGDRSFNPEAPSSEFYSARAPHPAGFTPSHGWVPANQTTTPVLAPVADKSSRAKDSSKGDKVTSEDAVKEEIRQQNKKLMDQRDQYLQKFNSLTEELSKLKKTKDGLVDTKTPQAEEFLRENSKLQTEISNKIKAVKNVIDMLSKIIKDEGMKGSADSSEEGSKKNSVDDDDGSKDHKMKRRSRSKSRFRSRSKSRHRSRSRTRRRSRSRRRSKSRVRPRSKSRARLRSRTRSRSRSRNRSRSRSRSPRSRRRRRSRSRDKYFRERRSDSRDRKRNKREKDEKVVSSSTSAVSPVQTSVAASPTVANANPPPPSPPVVETLPVEKPKVNKLSDRFKASFEEIYNRPVEPPKPSEGPKFSRFADKPKPVVELPVNAIPVPVVPEKPKSAKQHVSRGWVRGTAETVNYVYYDPEIHWCRVCNVFPKTAKEYLLHLHAQEHKQVLTANNLIDYPWHKNQPDARKPTNPGAPTERIPIRGLPFFVSATAWYCKLCDQWMGDLHCASAHLKSDEHESNYMTFLESNPKWEDHWLDSRAKAHSSQTVKAPEAVTPAYSMETYIKPNPIPPPPPPIHLRPTGDKKRSTSTSSTSSSSSSSSSSSARSHKKKKKNKKGKDRKRSAEKETKFKMVVSDAKKVRKMQASVPEPTVPSTVSFNDDEEQEDKFMQEWMAPGRSKSKEKDFQELKNKLNKKKEVVLPALPPSMEKNKAVIDAAVKRISSDRRSRSPERDRSRNKPSRFEDRRRSPRDDSRYKKTNGDSKSDKHSDKSNAGDSSKKSEGSGTAGGAPKKTIIDRRFPFIGKMPSKNALKKTNDPADAKAKANQTKEAAASTTSTAKAADPVKPAAADPAKPAAPPAKSTDQLAKSIQKQLAEYDRPKDVDVAVVDMDINEEEDQPVSIVVDDNISRKKDFDETLKLLYPENKPQPSQADIAAFPPNLSQDYLVSLIKSTIKDRQLTLNDGTPNSQILEIASTMQQMLFNNMTNIPNVADIPIPTDDRPAHISNKEQLYNVPLPDEPAAPGVEEEPEPAPPGTVDDSASVKKKKNPISQKKRRHMRKIREKLEEQEKLLQQKIEECTNQSENSEKSADGNVSASNSETSAANEDTKIEAEPSSPAPELPNVMDSDLMMLGIDEGDSAALLF